MAESIVFVPVIVKRGQGTESRSKRSLNTQLLCLPCIQIGSLFFLIVGIFRSNSLFTGANCRKAVNEGRADYTPIFLSEIPLLFQRKIIDLDVALIQVSPPDKHGFCTLGPSVDCTRSAIQNAKYIIGRSFK